MATITSLPLGLLLGEINKMASNERHTYSRESISSGSNSISNIRAVTMSYKLGISCKRSTASVYVRVEVKVKVRESITTYRYVCIQLIPYILNLAISLGVMRYARHIIEALVIRIMKGRKRRKRRKIINIIISLY